jgi:hypothetical protein
MLVNRRASSLSCSKLQKPRSCEPSELMPDNFMSHLLRKMGRDSAVGIATRYAMDGPGIEFRWGRDFPHPSRPALGPAQPLIQWLPGLSQG